MRRRNSMGLGQLPGLLLGKDERLIMSIKIGHAGSDERGKYHGGAAGDQNGREVSMRDWYNRPWNVVVRPKRQAVAAGIVRSCVAAVKNDNIGYDQYQRTTLYDKAKEAGWNLSKITTRCETDCSALVAVCVNAAGIKVSKDIYTGNMVKALLATGEFILLTDSKYLTSDEYLQAGDILVYEGHHTAMVLQYGFGVDYRKGWNYDVHGWFYSPEGHRDYLHDCWQDINHHRYRFNKDGYALTNWQQLGGKWYYFEPTAGDPLECAMYLTDTDGAQAPGEF